MATFNIVFDKRVKYKGDKYNVSIRVCHKKDNIYLPLVKLTEKEYNTVFVKKHIAKNCNELRKQCNKELARAEKIYSEMLTFSRKRFTVLFKDKDYQPKKDEDNYPKSFEIKELFNYFISNSKDIKTNTRKHFQTSMNAVEEFLTGATIFDITKESLSQLEQYHLSKGTQRTTINSYMRDLRRIINYFISEVKVIPKNYTYPFGKGQYSIREVRKKKMVLTPAEILSVIEFDDFENDYQEYCRDIFLTLYYINGINFIDLLRLRWDNIKNGNVFYYRKKTESTRKSIAQEINAPLIPSLIDLLNKIGDPTSPYVLGEMKEGYKENTLMNRKNKLRQMINPELTKIGKKLKLSVPLKMSSARDCFANTCRLNGFSHYQIGQQLGHSSVVSTSHYIGSLDMDESLKISQSLVMKREKKNLPENLLENMKFYEN